MKKVRFKNHNGRTGKWHVLRQKKSKKEGCNEKQGIVKIWFHRVIALCKG